MRFGRGGGGGGGGGGDDLSKESIKTPSPLVFLD